MTTASPSMTLAQKLERSIPYTSIGNGWSEPGTDMHGVNPFAWVPVPGQRAWSAIALVLCFALSGAILPHLASCQSTAKGPAIGSTAGQLASNFEAGNVNADLTTIGHSADALVPHVDAPGKPLVVTIQQSAAHATTQVAAIQQSIVDTKVQTDKQLVDAVAVQKSTDADVLKKQIDADAVAKAEAVTAATKAANENANKPVIKILWALAIFGFVGFVGGIAVDLLVTLAATKAIGKAIAMIGVILCVCSIGLVFGIETLTALVPIFVIGATAVFGTVVVLLIITLIRERGIFQTAVVDVANDVATHKQPAVPYSANTTKVVKSVVSTAAAMPVPPAA